MCSSDLFAGDDGLAAWPGLRQRLCGVAQQLRVLLLDSGVGFQPGWGMSWISPVCALTLPTDDAGAVAWKLQAAGVSASCAIRDRSLAADDTRSARPVAGLAPVREPVRTIDLLVALNQRVQRAVSYVIRLEPGVQSPEETLLKGSGSCRDFAVLMMEAARHWGFAARFVSGYIQMAEGQHGATHAWTEIYLPGAGWQGFDPTNDKRVGREHIAVAVAREQEKAMPVAGSWFGAPDDFLGLEVKVEVVAT